MPVVVVEEEVGMVIVLQWLAIWAFSMKVK
jgi:hypothetical protein